MPDARHQAIRELRRLFERNGYVRTERHARPKAGGHGGFEMRFAALSDAERNQILRLIKNAGFRPGRPFRKGAQYRVPAYGREQVSRLASLVGGRAETRRATPRDAV